MRLTWAGGRGAVTRIVKRVSRVVNPIISIRFRRSRGRRGAGLPDVRSTLGVGQAGKGFLVMRMRRRVNRSAIEAVTVSDASKLRHNVGIVSAKGPVAVPMNARVEKHIVGIIKRAVSNLRPLSARNTCPVRHRTPGFRSLTAARRILFANVGIVSLLRPCLGKNGVKLFKNTKINGAILVGRLVGGVTGGRGKFSIFTKINRHAHRNGSLLHRVVRSKIVGCNRSFRGDVRRNR